MSEPTRDEEREAAIRRVVDAAPPITAEQIVKLRRIFASTRTVVAPAACDLPCDDDCEAGCHQAHLPRHKRRPDMCRCATQGRTP